MHTLSIDTVLCIFLEATRLFAFVQESLILGDNVTIKVNCNAVHYRSTNDTTKCSSLPWKNGSLTNSTNGRNVSVYTGSVCRQQLLAWQECAVGDAEDVFLDLTFMEQSQEKSERDVARFLHFLRKLALSLHTVMICLKLYSESSESEYCQQASAFLVCQSSFPLCDCQSGHTYLASREECEKISMVECEEEWTSASQYGIPLPNCTELSGHSVTKKGGFTVM